MSSIRAALACVLAVVACGHAVSALAGNIEVPWIRQKTSSECGRAVLASLAARKGGDIEKHYRRLPPPPDRVRGYSVRDMQRFGVRVGVALAVTAPDGLVIAGECSPRPPVTAHFARIAELVAAGVPVVVPVSIGGGLGHYYVLVGAEGGGFTALDPGSPGLKRFSTSELSRRMCHYGYLALMAQ